MKKNYMKVSVFSVAAVLGVWIVGSALNCFNPTFIPSVKDVLDAFRNLWENGYKGYPLMYHIAASMRRLGIAMLLVFIVGTALGIACGMNRKILAAVDPFIQFYRALPPLAYNTLIVLWMGIGDGSKIMLLFLSGFAPLFIQIVFGVQKVPQDRINGARSLGAGNFVIFRDVILPSVLPDILTGLRTAVGVSYATLVAAEMIASASGLAWMVLDASKYILYATVYAGIFIMGGIALLIDGGLKLLIRKAMPWQETV